MTASIFRNNMMELDKSQSKSYNQILKTTAVFGSVKIFSVLIGLFKAKIIAIFLGPAGMGIFNLINYPVTLFSQFSGLGISTSGIREVAQAQDERQLAEIAEVIKYWNRTLGVIGSLILFALAPWVSELSFGNDSYAWAFQILSVVVFLTNLSSEYEVLLRGRRETKLVAKAGFYSSLAGFITSIPFYYAFGTAGIVVVILITAITFAGANYLYARKLNIQLTGLPYCEIFKRGKNLILIGFFIVLGDLIFVSVITAVNTYIRSKGGVEDVGYFQACMQITQSSINIVLMSMAADYYPRLSGLQGKSKETSIVASQQAEIATLLCTPVVCSLIVFAPLVIKILLTSDFIVVKEAICWFIVGSIFRLPSWAMNFVVLANGKTKLYVALILTNNILLFPLYCIGYYYGGLIGLGLSFLCLTILYSIIQNIVIKRVLNVSFSVEFWKTYSIGVILSLMSMFSLLNANPIIKCIIVVVILTCAFLYAFYYLERKTAFVSKVFAKISIKK